MKYENIEQVLSELVVRVASYFKIDMLDALSAVATSKLANKLSRDGNTGNLSIDELSERIFTEISKAE